MSKIPGLPDWPIVGHLTWREAHLFELGLWPGIGVGVALAGQEVGAALALIAVIRKRMRNKRQNKDADDLVKGYKRDAWYFAVGALAGLLLGYGLLTLAT